MKTPRTDKAEEQARLCYEMSRECGDPPYPGADMADFARKLEEELNELQVQLATSKATALREAAIRSLESASMPMSATHWLHAEADRISKEGKQ
jgi:hypothetical protein